MDQLEINKDCCRICLSRTSARDLFFTIIDIERYLLCTGYHINPLDVPQKICHNCRGQLRRFENFKKRSLDVETKLQKFHNQVLINREQEQQLLDLEDHEIEDDTCEINDNLCIQTIENRTDNDIILSEPQIIDENEESNQSTVRSLDCQTNSSIAFESDNNIKVMPQQITTSKRARQRNRKTYNACHYCHRVFNSRKAKNNHEAFDHPPNPLFYCDLCNSEKSFKTKVKLSMHFVHFHGDVVPCKECGKMVKKLRMHIHLKRVHSDEKNCFCEICGQGFPLRIQLDRHYIRKHTERKDYKLVCNFCGKRFSEHTRLLYHKAIHTPQDFTCDICAKVFTTKRYLEQHKKVHEKDSYQCPLCPQKTFSFTTTLRAHITNLHPNIILPPSGTVLKNYDWSNSFVDSKK